MIPIFPCQTIDSPSMYCSPLSVCHPPLYVMMSKQKTTSSVKLTFDNWTLWNCNIKSTIRHKNAYIVLDPKPANPHTKQQAIPMATVVTMSTTATPAVAVTPQPTAEELKMYRDELKEWRSANNVVAGLILGLISNEVEHIINPEESTREMYDNLKVEILKQLSRSSAYSTQINLICKKLKETPMPDTFEKHLTFYHSKNASLIAVGAGFDDPFLAFLLLYSFSALEDPVWSMASTTIATSDTPINKWSFNQVAGKLHEAMCNSNHNAEVSTAGNSPLELNTTANKPNLTCYTGPACTYPNCKRPKSHPIEKCWTMEKDEREKARKDKKKHKAKKAKKKATISSSSESSSESSESEAEQPKKKCHHAKMLRNLKATIDHAHSYHGKASGSSLFVVHPDSGASNHMTHNKELFNHSSFKDLLKPIPISLRDDSEIFATGKGMIHLLFNIDG